MRRSHFDRVERPAVARRDWLLLGGALLALGIAAPVAAQEITVTQDTVVAEADSVVGAAVSVSEDEASIDLELSDGRTVQLSLDDGVVYADGERIGSYNEGGFLDDSWRQLLEAAAMSQTSELPALLRSWTPPAEDEIADLLDQRLELALSGVGGRIIAGGSRIATSAEDSIDELLARIDELEERHHWDDDFDDDDSPAEAFANDLVEGIASFFATLVWIGVLLALGSAILFFAEGRLERLSATVREEPLRSGLIGLAGAFLAIPFYVLVMLALAISILGIPLIIAWAPLFPLFMVLGSMAGWLAVAYSAGDAMVSGKLQARPLFQTAGPVKRLFVGIALLLSPFLAASLFKMLPGLDWVAGLLFAIGVIGNILVAAVGFGAVLVRTRDAMDRHREKRAAAKRARLEQQTVVVTPEGTNV